MKRILMLAHLVLSIGLLALFFSRIASASELLAPEKTTPASVCATKPAPKFCGWPKEKIMAHEQRIVERAIKQIKKRILPSLDRAVWVPYTPTIFDKTNPLTEAYCTNKLTALREGRGRYFPPPQAKSSEIGVQMLKQQREEKARLLGCDRSNAGRPISGDKWYLEPYTEWFYALPGGFARLYLNPVRGYVSLESVLDQCNEYIHIQTSVDDAKKPQTGRGDFAEQTVGLVEIDGELFGLEGGVLRMSDSGWRYSIYGRLVFNYYDGVDLQPLDPSVEEKTAQNQNSGAAPEYKVTTSLIKSKFKFSAAQQKSFDKDNTWLGHIFLLYPLNPPWRGYYRQLQIPEDEPRMDDGYSAYSKPCMWNIPD